jgi:hypothetical protein
VNNQDSVWWYGTANADEGGSEQTRAGGGELVASCDRHDDRRSLYCCPASALYLVVLFEESGMGWLSPYLLCLNGLVARQTEVKGVWRGINDS